MERGEVWWAWLQEPRGSAPGFRRPVVVVQSDLYTRSRIDTVLVVMLTTNMRLAAAPGNVMVAAGETGLPRDCVANVSQIATVDKADLDECVGRIPDTSMRRVDAGLRRVLALV